MVLKVVTSKILKTLELSCLPAGCRSILEQEGYGRSSIVKEHDYLVDNLRIAMLSLVKDEGQ